MGLFSSSKSSSSTTNNNYDNRVVNDFDIDTDIDNSLTNDGALSGNTGTINYSLTDGGAFSTVEATTRESISVANNALDSYDEATRFSFGLAGDALRTLTDGQEKQSKVLTGALNQVAASSNSAITGGQTQIINSLGNTMKWVIGLAAAAYAISNMKG